MKVVRVDAGRGIESCILRVVDRAALDPKYVTVLGSVGAQGRVETASLSLGLWYSAAKRALTCGQRVIPSLDQAE